MITALPPHTSFYLFHKFVFSVSVDRVQTSKTDLLQKFGYFIELMRLLTNIGRKNLKFFKYRRQKTMHSEQKCLAKKQILKTVV